MKQAKMAGADCRQLSADTYVLRAFSRDNNEVEENWQKLFSCGKFDMIILDSVSELYPADRKPGIRNQNPEPGNWKQGTENKPMLYSIGRFIQLCIKNDCIGIALDFSPRIHPYLAHTSSIIIDFEIDRHEVAATVRKHHSLPEGTYLIPRDRQYKLGRWM
jgi:hypothetical protein